MRLTCNNFKAFENRDFILPDRGLVLLDGPSGTGKTTFTKAILFALFGNVSKPYTFGKKKLSVELQMGNLNISRQKGPERLLVGNYEDDVAQGLIHKTIGMTEQEFIAACYIQQKMSNSLLTLSPKDQLQFIESLAFAGNSPEEFKQKMSKYMNEKKKEMDRLSGKLEVLIEQQNAIGNELLSLTRPEKPSEVTVPEDIEIQISSLQAQYKALSEKVSELNALINDPRYEEKITAAQMVEMAKHAKAEAEKELEDLLSKHSGGLDALEVQKASLEDQILILRAREELAKNKRDLDSLIDEQFWFLESKDDQLKGLNGFLEQNAHTKETLERLAQWVEWIENVKKLKGHAKDFFERFDLALKGEELERSVARILNTEKEGHELFLENLRQKEVSIPLEIKSLKNTLDMHLSCPECGANLKHHDGTLIHSSGFSPAEVESKIASLAEELERVKKDRAATQEQNEKVLADIKTLNWIIETRMWVQSKKPEHSFSPDIDNCLKEIERLKAIEVEVDKVYRQKIAVESTIFPDAHKIEGLKEAVRDDSEFLKAKEGVEVDPEAALKLEEIKVSIANRSAEQDRIEKARQSIQKRSEQIQEYENRLKSINLPSKPSLLEKLSLAEADRQQTHDKLNELRELFNRFNTYKSQLAQYNLQISKIKHVEARSAKTLKDIEEINQEVKALEEKYAHASYIKSVSDKAQMAAVTNIINSINTYAKDYLDILFPEQPMNVQLCPFKENKDGSVRFKLSTVVSYRGQENIDFKEEVSGGENDRIVLAYQLALNHLYDSPIIMLDEPFTGLNQELVELAMDSLRLISQEKLVIVVSHGIDKGQFDEVISFD